MQLHQYIPAALQKIGLLNRPTKRPHLLLPITLGIAFVIGLGVSVWLYNDLENRKEVKLEVTFVEPRQAVVFWKTEKPSVGYVRYGDTKHRRNLRAEQTSSIPSEIHAVVLENVPLDGFYISIHTDSDSPLFWPAPRQIKYDHTTIE